MNDAALERIAAALDRLAPPPEATPDLGAAPAFVWHTNPDRLEPVTNVNRVDVSLLVGVDRSRDTLMANTLQRSVVGRTRDGKVQPCQSDPRCIASRLSAVENR